MWRGFLYTQTRKKLCTFFKKILCRYYFQSHPLLTIIIGLLGLTQRAAQNPSVIVAKEGIITTNFGKHRQTLAQAAFNFQINNHHELRCSSPFPPLQKKAKCFCLFLVCHTNHSRLEKSSNQTPINVTKSSFEVFQINHNHKLEIAEILIVVTKVPTNLNISSFDKFQIKYNCDLIPFPPFSITGQPL